MPNGGGGLRDDRGKPPLWEQVKDLMETIKGKECANENLSKQLTEMLDELGQFRRVIADQEVALHSLRLQVAAYQRQGCKAVPPPPGGMPPTTGTMT